MTKRMPSQAEKAKRMVVELLKDEPGFVGAGISRGTSGHHEIIVLVKDKSSPVLEKAPGECEGIPVRIQIAGAPKKF